MTLFSSLAFAHKRKQGLSSIEALLAILIAALAVAAGAAGLSGITGRHDGLLTGFETTTEIETAFAVFSRDLRAASPHRDGAVFTARTDAGLWRFDFSADLAAGSPPAEVGYRVRPSRAGTGMALWRRVQTPADADPLSGGTEAVMLESADAIRVRFFNGSTWKAVWGWNAAEMAPYRNIRGLPVLFDLRIQKDGETFRDIGPIMTTLINRIGDDA